MSTLSVARFSWRLFRYRPWLYLLAMTLFAGFAAAPFLSGLLVKVFFDQLSGATAAGLNLWSLLALLVGIEFGRALALYGWLFSWFNFATMVEVLLRSNMFAWLTTGSGARLPDSPGEAVNRFRDDIEDVLWFFDCMIDVAGSLSFAIAALVVMIRIDLLITVAVFLPLAIVLVVVRGAGVQIQRNREAAREASGAFSGLLGEIFSATQTIKTSGAEGRLIGELRRLGDWRMRAQLRDRVFSELILALNSHTADIGLGLVLLLAASSFRSGAFTVGDFALFAGYLTTLAGLPRWLGQLLVRWRQLGVAYERIRVVHHGAPASQISAYRPTNLYSDPPAPAQPAPIDEPLTGFEIRAMRAMHPESKRGIDRVDLVIPGGSFTVITGRVGAGKTTLLRALLGLIPLEGEIRWNGEPVADPGAFLVPPRAAYVPQVPRLFSDSLEDNILLGWQSDAQALQAAIHTAALDYDLGRLDHLRPNEKRFPAWDAPLASDMRQETLAFFKHVVWDEKRPIWDLFNAQVTFATPR
ncbi:MAG: ATP-binding cassette domain-containing protein, partial [Oscillochloris sp.]|nr:ATP-binding cassette domain-containing protein [Oscillochloris sp.]